MSRKTLGDENSVEWITVCAKIGIRYIIVFIVQCDVVIILETEMFGLPISTLHNLFCEVTHLQRLYPHFNI